MLASPPAIDLDAEREIIVILIDERMARRARASDVGSSFGPLRNVFTQPRPEAVIGRTEIPQRSSLPPYRDVLSFRSGAPTAPTSIQDLLACREVIR